MENETDGRTMGWHILWSPVGFGNTTAKLVELWEAIKIDDPGAETDMYFPTYMDRLHEREVMVPLFPNYVFVRCRWHQGLEDRITDTGGIFATFLRDVGATQPHRMDQDELDRIKTAHDSRVELVKEWLYVDGLHVGDVVRVKNMAIAGTILYFLPPNKAMIETTLFNQKNAIPVKISALEKL